MSIKEKISQVLKLLSTGIDSHEDARPTCLFLLVLKAISKNRLDLDVWQHWILNNLNSPQIIEHIYNAIKYTTDKIESANEIFKGFKLDKWNQSLDNFRAAINVLDSLDSSNSTFLGDIYENMINFKFGAEYYTPSCLCRLFALLSLIDNPDPKEIYDPTCGSAGLLMSVYNEANNKPHLYGQELNEFTFKLAKGNLIIHGADPGFIKLGCTLNNPQHKNLKFDTIVTNPPFSARWDQFSDERFQNYTLAPKTKADMAFILHALHHLKDDGVLIAVVFPGVFYREGREKMIRKELINNNLVDCIIELPGGLFINSSINVGILILKKNRTQDSVLFINCVSLFGVEKFKWLTEEQIQQILDIYKNKKEIPYISKLVSKKEIEEGEFNLSVSRYIDIFKPENNEKYSDISKEADDVAILQIQKILWSSLAFHELDKNLFNEPDRPFRVLDETYKTCDDIKKSMERGTWSTDVDACLKEWKKKRLKEEV